MNTSENHKKDLKSLLPKHRVGADLWNRIEKQLHDVGQMPELPLHAANENLWQPIAHELDAAKSRQFRKRTLQIVSYATAVAASLMLIMVISGVLKKDASMPNSVVVHSVEVVENEPVVTFASIQGGYGEEHIVEYCSNFPNVCVDPEFIQLKNKWQRLKNELAQLRSMSQPGANEQVNYYIARIEMDIRQLENKMMHKFM